MARVGICEDDRALRSVLERALKQWDHAVVVTATAGEALRAFPGADLDVLLLDIGLPDGDGRDLCLALKAAGVGAPVLMLTALSDTHHKVAGFEAGADDYLTKPFELAELRARVGVLARRSAPAAGPELGEPALRLDPRSHAIVSGDRQESLSPTEFRLLARLMSVPGEVVRRQALVAAAWPDGAMVSDNTLDSYIRRLRSKLAGLDPDGPGIVTARGVGYSWR